MTVFIVAEFNICMRTMERLHISVQNKLSDLLNVYSSSSDFIQYNAGRIRSSINVFMT